ncbi:MAG: cytochrome c oxidase subunit 2 [Rhodothermales bacterium]|jgi:cytochrome c oxidase subunit 2
MQYFLLLLFFAASVIAEELPADHPFASCAACHGATGQGNEELRAPRLAGQDIVYLRLQIEAFRKGWRDGKPEEPSGIMTAIAKSLEPEAIAAAIDYVATLKPEAKRDRVFGLRMNGEYLYRASCAICHGDRAEGSEYHMPVLNMQHGWYLREQIAAFRSGKRGHVAADKAGTTMAFYASLLKDDREVRDIAAYLSALKAAP